MNLLNKSKNYTQAKVKLASIDPSITAKLNPASPKAPTTVLSPTNRYKKSEPAAEEEQVQIQSQRSFSSTYSQRPNAFENIEAQLLEIIESEEVNDVVDLNEKFLAQQLGGINPEDLAMLPKIELRVDTHFHNLQVTGEILTSLEELKLNDSII